MKSLTPERLEKLKRVVSGLGPQPKILITQLDFDAKGEAMLLRYTLKRWIGCECQIFYAGNDDDLQTKTTFGILGLAAYMTSLKKFRGDTLGDVILVDSNRKHDSRVRDVTFNPVIAIDHHPDSDLVESDATWFCNDTLAGAGTTIVGEIFRALDLEVIDDHEWQIVCTIAALGIDMDTHHFSEKIDRRRDREIWHWLRNYAINTSYSELLRLNRPVRYYDLLHEVTDRKRWLIKETLLVMNVGLIDEDELDWIALFADELLLNALFQTVIVWAPVKGVGVCGKIRTDKPSEDLEDLIKKLDASGGGKGNIEFGIGAAAFTRPMDEFSAPDGSNTKELIKWFDKCLRRALEIPENGNEVESEQ